MVYLIMARRADRDHMVGVVGLVDVPMFDVMDMRPPMTATGVRTLSTSFLHQPSL